jgi:type VI secretion system secreted protein Hcp
MAQTFHCKMTIGGQPLIGSSSQWSSGGVNRADGFEGLSLELVGRRAVKGESAWATGRRHWQPIRIRKVVDRATPLLVDAFVGGKRIDTFECIFFRPSPTGGGAQHDFTIKGTDGRIRSHRIDSGLLAEGDTSARMYEEFELVAEKMDWEAVRSGPTDWSR